jgi:uncharacterized protein
MEFIPTDIVYQRSQGMLRKKLYAISTVATGDLAAVGHNTPAHLEYQLELEQRGILFAAGPLWEEDGDRWRGEGLIVVRAESHEEAVAIAEADPMHSSGARSYSIRPWLVNEGSITLKMSFSGQSAQLM